MIFAIKIQKKHINIKLIYIFFCVYYFQESTEGIVRIQSTIVYQHHAIMEGLVLIHQQVILVSVERVSVKYSQACLTFQDNSEIWSYKTGDCLIQVHHEEK